ncbi:MAG TPA: transposase [Blastocatellia bacterium]|nr:transposase [Blastocatellia bacterium]
METDNYVRKNTLRLKGFDYSSKRIYFVTTVAKDRLNFFLNHQLSYAVLDSLFELRIQYQFNLYCYCLMPNHFHGLIGAGASEKTLGDIVGGFKSCSTKVFWRWHGGKLWQPRFNDHIIRNEQDFQETMNYILQNPVRKGLAERPEDWPFSGTLDAL